jgi:DNA primase
LVVSANEQTQHTAAIHQRQRARFQQTTPTEQTILKRHQNAQRLLQPLPVTMPWATRLTFRTDQVRYRRGHATYLTLIAAIALLHQYQRQQVTRRGRGLDPRFPGDPRFHPAAPADQANLISASHRSCKLQKDKA